MAATGAKVAAHASAASRIAGVDRGLKAGDVIKVGRTVELECLDTPGHTMTHICLLSHTEQPALFCGDTLFNAGAGNCHNGGASEALYDTFVTQLASLPPTTRVYPGHDYLARNLSSRSTASRTTPTPRALLEAARAHDPAAAHVTTLAEEKRINTFFRLQQPAVIAGLREEVPRPAGAARCADRVRQAARIAQPLVRRGALTAGARPSSRGSASSGPRGSSGARRCGTRPGRR